VAKRRVGFRLIAGTHAPGGGAYIVDRPLEHIRMSENLISRTSDIERCSCKLEESTDAGVSSFDHKNRTSVTRSLWYQRVVGLFLDSAEKWGANGPPMSANIASQERTACGRPRGLVSISFSCWRTSLRPPSTTQLPPRTVRADPHLGLLIAPFTSPSSRLLHPSLRRTLLKMPDV
jgi:hypothetical protein